MKPTAIISQAEYASGGGPFPGLFDVTTPDGEILHDLTLAQVSSVAMARGWNLVAAPSDERQEEPTV